MKTSTQLTHNSTSLTLSATLQIIATSLIALVVLYGVGFNEMDIAHNAAHDARHAAAFPCH
jgi:cobalt transporter subunit CbtB